ncbi:MAG TPA: hypothetical protein VLH09_05900, partial [Bryobacteraceae bacterium]|nr:hypothetical protein [Bryobacteraceae bacterium]
MACSQYEALIALYVEGDHVTPETEDHLRACADCRALAGELRQSQELVRSLREEEIPDAALAAVRSRVLDRVASRRPSWVFALRWWHGLAAGAATAVVAFLMLPGPAVPPPASPPSP